MVTSTIRVTAPVTDMRDKAEYERVEREALAGVEPPHSLIGITSPAWPGMVVEVEVTAGVPNWMRIARFILT
ncbi:hypothetical protein MSTO_36570 [Mycobacterium stomatepiae]|uniref:Uncharacterized protein n=1 Tax=Mycobacterium stomatepiae TaxID=470076 RepID=A0A7I7QBI2_9MYCO|nr:hypothetical protein [Mycobacterium stomatepiae]BBY23452.1 hypothetical protein MSTO_36570 [Mycobacterium stomatepiae]